MPSFPPSLPAEPIQQYLHPIPPPPQHTRPPFPPSLPIPPPFSSPSSSSSSPLPPLPQQQRPSTPAPPPEAAPASEPQPEPETKLYSLPPLPDWPPPRSSYPDSHRNFKVLWDPQLDGATLCAPPGREGREGREGKGKEAFNPEKLSDLAMDNVRAGVLVGMASLAMRYGSSSSALDANGNAAASGSGAGTPNLHLNATQKPPRRDGTYYKALLEHVKRHGGVPQKRIRGSKDKGKEVLIRWEGEVVGPFPEKKVKGEEESKEVVKSDAVGKEGSMEGVVDVCPGDPRQTKDEKMDIDLPSEPAVTSAKMDLYTSSTTPTMIEEEPVPRDPRQDPRFKVLLNRARLSRPYKESLLEVAYDVCFSLLDHGAKSRADFPLPFHRTPYPNPKFTVNSIRNTQQHDSHSLTPPPTGVLLTCLPPLTSTSILKEHYRKYAPNGQITSFEWQVNRANGAALGVLYLKYNAPEHAAACVKGEDGRAAKFGANAAAGTGNKGAAGKGGGADDEKIRAVLDDEGKTLKAVLRELEVRAEREKEDRRRREKGLPPLAVVEAQAAAAAATQAASANGAANGVVGKQETPHQGGTPNGQQTPSQTQKGQGQSRPPPGKHPLHHTLPANPMLAHSHSAHMASPLAQANGAATPTHHAHAQHAHPQIPGLPPIPVVHVRNKGDEPRKPADALLKARAPVLKDHLGWYVTFRAVDVAAKATRVLSNSSTRQLAYQQIELTVANAPALPAQAPKDGNWDDIALAAAAEDLIIKELRTLLAKDIKERLMGAEMRAAIAREREKLKAGPIGGLGVGAAGVGEKRGLKGLSFKKQPKPKLVVEEVRAVETPEPLEQEEEEDGEGVQERPKKKRKQELVRKVTRKIVVGEVESEDDDAAMDTVRKRTVSEEMEDDEQENEPIRKKQKVEVEILETKTKKGKKKKTVKKKVDTVADALFPDELEFEVPSIVQLHITPESSLSLSPGPETKRAPPRVVTPPPTPPLDPYHAGLCEDDEDVYFLKLALAGYQPPDEEDEPTPPPPDLAPPETPAFRKHVTGSARTEGFYKITHAEKAAYVAQYQARATTSVEATPVIEEPQQHITSSRSNRANARRRAQGLEEINQVQRAVALSKGENAANELSFKFNQLQTRKKHLRFARSPIHDWGLYALEKISRGEMVIEYVGEVIRAQVAEKREKAYERQGIGSSYLFRIDEDLVVDATKKGNLGYV
ncbi:hypothetical protein DXG03_007979 [Asterophora parasitica]|uniref:Histone-lysine N-methyltransferase, H3 lysine-4 specific n=1 Tax=Asterophora parasitica TaxID=117018 RepID=A0A9P7GCB8_9AGAR|nr:hypothetical protein DXG03_007979 [Asterophora parasitica]